MQEEYAFSYDIAEKDSKVASYDPSYACKHDLFPKMRPVLNDLLLGKT